MPPPSRKNTTFSKHTRQVSQQNVARNIKTYTQDLVSFAKICTGLRQFIRQGILQPVFVRQKKLGGLPVWGLAQYHITPPMIFALWDIHDDMSSDRSCEGILSNGVETRKQLQEGRKRNSLARPSVNLPSHVVLCFRPITPAWPGSPFH